MAFNIYEWRRNQLLLENENDFNYGTYSKDEVIAKVGPGGQVRWFNKVVTVDELPDQVQFTKVISGIPTFINAGEYKDMGDSDKTIDYQMGLDKNPTLDEMGGDKKMYGIEKNSTPYDFGPYTYEEAKAKSIELSAKNFNNIFQPKPLSNMEDDLPAIDRMGMPGRSTRGMSSGDLGDY